MSNSEKPKPPSLLKWVGIPVLGAIAFMGLLYLAMATEPDYMPANQKKAAGVDIHANHANAASSSHQSTEHTANDATDDHASHSATEHAEAVAAEAPSHTDEAAHSSSSTAHGH